MNDMYLPFDDTPLSVENRDDHLTQTDGPDQSVDRILANIDRLKQSLQDSESHQKCIKLSEQIQTAISALAMPQQQTWIPPADDKALISDVVMAYGANQRYEHFEKIISYFRSLDDFLHAPENLLRAHGIPANTIKTLSQSASRKHLLDNASRIAQFMREHHWTVLRSRTLAEASSSITAVREALPALFFVRGDVGLIRRTKVAIVGEKQQMPAAYHAVLPALIDQLKSMNIVPVCNLLQQSSFQFALSAVRKGHPSILILSGDMIRAFEKNYRFLSYFVDHGCLLATYHIPLTQQRQTTLQLFKVKMALAKTILLFPKYFENYELGDYSARYWPVLNHCHQMDKVCLLYNPPSAEPRVSQVLQAWESQEPNISLYKGFHELRLIFQTLETKGYLSRDLCQKALGALTNVTVLH